MAPAAVRLWQQADILSRPSRKDTKIFGPNSGIALPPLGSRIGSPRMSSRPPPATKTVLGRGLDQLMTGTKTSGQGTGGESTASTIKVDIQAGPGLATLLRGTGTSVRSRPADSVEKLSGGISIPNRTVLGLSLAAADLLLLGQSARLVSNNAPTLSFAEWALAFLGVGLGAWLGCLAVLLFGRKGR